MVLSPAAAMAGADDRFDEFEVVTYASGLMEPVAMAFAPDERLFVGPRGGQIHIVDDGAVIDPPFAEIEVFGLGEAGLLGLALDPDFDENGYVYIFATVSETEQQIIRFTDDGGMGVDRTVIRDNLPTNGSIHNGGGLRFGPDGKLYFSIGDNGDSELSQQIQTLAGKVCRINADGSTPDDNPFVTPTGAPRAVYALGLRNPFRLCFAPDGRLFVGDVGSSGDARREEINFIVVGGNYGWPIVEGFDEDQEFSDLIDPILAYADAGSSIAGCVFYDADQFPKEFAGNLFHLDFVSGGLFRVPLDGTRAASHELVIQGGGGPVDLAQGPDGSLYYSELFTGEIKQVRHRDAADLVLGEDPPDIDDSETNTEDDSDPPPQDNSDSPPTSPNGMNLCGAGTMAAVFLSMPVMLHARHRRRRTSNH